MHYKTIILELIREDPEIHGQLKRSGLLVTTLDHHAQQLKGRHEAWKEAFAKARSGSEPERWSGEALELALAETKVRLSFRPKEDGSEALSLDDSMQYLRRVTPSV